MIQHRLSLTGMKAIPLALMILLLAAAPASAATVLSGQTSNPGAWTTPDTSALPSMRCIYKMEGYQLNLHKIKVWPPTASSKSNGTKLRWRFFVDYMDEYPQTGWIQVGSTSWSNVYNVPLGSSTKFGNNTQAWTVPSSWNASLDNTFRVRVRIEWRNSQTTTGYVTYTLSYARWMPDDEVVEMPCLDVAGIA